MAKYRNWSRLYSNKKFNTRGLGSMWTPYNYKRYGHFAGKTGLARAFAGSKGRYFVKKHVY